MPINMQFAPDLVLRNIMEFNIGARKQEECIPENLIENEIYEFLKHGQRAYWLEGQQPLLEKKTDGSISFPIASVRIIEVVHFIENNQIYTKGQYKIIKVLQKNEVYFNGCEPKKLSLI